MDKQVITIDDSGDELAQPKKGEQPTPQHPGESFLRSVTQDQYNQGTAIKPEFKATPIAPGLYENSEDEIRKMAELGLPTHFQQQGPDYLNQKAGISKSTLFAYFML